MTIKANEQNIAGPIEQKRFARILFVFLLRKLNNNFFPYFSMIKIKDFKRRFREDFSPVLRAK